MTMKMPNSSLAIHADAAAIPAKPKIAATMAIIKKTNAQYSRLMPHLVSPMRTYHRRLEQRAGRHGSGILLKSRQQDTQRRDDR
jgi:hypothetical protein